MPNVTKDNQPWDRTEIILALDLYLTHGPLGHSNPLVIELSGVLRDLPLNPVRPDPERYRNPNGVGLKLANFKALDPNRPGGMDAYSKLDEEMWDRFHEDPEGLHALADTIRDDFASGKGSANGSSDSDLPTYAEEGEEEVIEGTLLYRKHRQRERNAGLVKRKKLAAMKKGELKCEVCDFDFKSEYGDLGDGYIECHHILPLSTSGKTTTKASDMALLCANCHRMAHRGSPWPTVNELHALRGVGH